MDSNRNMINNSKKATAKYKISTPDQRISMRLFSHRGINRRILQ